jgi:hypothetical protein
LQDKQSSRIHSAVICRDAKQSSCIPSLIIRQWPYLSGADQNQLNTNPEKTKSKVLSDFAESPENQTGVLSLIGSGIAYEPWVG